MTGSGLEVPTAFVTIFSRRYGIDNEDKVRYYQGKLRYVPEKAWIWEKQGLIYAQNARLKLHEAGEEQEKAERESVFSEVNARRGVQPALHQAGTSPSQQYTQ